MRGDPHDGAIRPAAEIGPVALGNRSKEKYSALKQLARGMVVYLLPLVLLFAVVNPTLNALLPSEWFDTHTLRFFESAKKFELFARDVDGRVSVSVFSAAIYAVSLAAIAYAFLVVKRRFPSAKAAGIIVLAIVLGLAICYAGGGADNIACRKDVQVGPHSVEIGATVGFRAVVLDDVICVAEREKKTGAGALTRMRFLILLNSLAGFAAASAVMMALAVIAAGGGPGPVVDRLRYRLNAFKILSLVASMLFVLNALITKALVTWAQSLLDSADAPAYGKFAGSLLNYWAAQSSAVLFAVLVCAAAGIQRQIEDATKTEIQPGPSAPDITKWKKQNGLTFDLSTVLTATIGTVAPLLASPAADLVGKVTKALH